MFRRLPGSLPEDQRFSADLQGLGYFINDKSQVRKIAKPTERFQYKLTNNERVNSLQREAMQTCLRREIEKRMADIGAPVLYLPQVTITKPTAPFVPIFATPQSILKSKKRVLIVVNDNNQDLGVWSYRMISGDPGIDNGSCIGLAKDIKNQSSSAPEEEPGLIVMNPGQLLYSYRENRALGFVSWLDKRKETAVHPIDRINVTYNHAEGHATVEEHIASVFDKIVKDPEWVSKDAQLYIIGVHYGGNIAIDYLNANWSYYEMRVAAIALTSPHQKRDQLKPNFAGFLEKRARAWIVSSAPFGTVTDAPYHVPAKVPEEDEEGPETTKSHRTPPVCPIFSSAEPYYTECVVPAVLETVLAWFRDVAADRHYCNPDFEVMEWEDEVLEAPVPDWESQAIRVPELDVNCQSSEDKIFNEADTPNTHVIDISAQVAALRVKEAMADKGHTEAKTINAAHFAKEKAKTINEFNGEDNEAEKVKVAGLEVKKSLLEKAGLLDSDEDD